VRSRRGISHMQASMLSVAVVIALVLVWISPDARGATTTTRIDEDPQGAPYAAGELLVTYEPGASRQRVGEVVDVSRARVEEEISVADTQLLSFPAIEHEQSGRVREAKLRKAREVLQRRPGVVPLQTGQ
jgi:hypothetical protein